ncbi:MAG: DUF1294 domain-containing protein [Alphaproteobacteria bacterium]|nr:DUF1294 domain-containing protein [Alphaproteobacteria bacterium]
MDRETGELVDWKDDRGFGFIRRPDGLNTIFVHIRSIRRGAERPKIGDRMAYGIGEGKGGRPVATDVEILADAPKAAAPAEKKLLGRPVRPAPLLSARVWAAAILLALLAANIIFGLLPAWTLALYLIAGAGSFWFYRDDKQAANARRSRTPERKLHILDLCFGIIGGLLAQHLFRHKTYKPGYVFVTGLITALHILVLGLILLGVLAPNSLGRGLQQLTG